MVEDVTDIEDIGVADGAKSFRPQTPPLSLFEYGDFSILGYTISATAPPLLAHFVLTLLCRYRCIVSATFPPWVTSRGVLAPPLWVRFRHFLIPLYGFLPSWTTCSCIVVACPILDLRGVPLDLLCSLDLPCSLQRLSSLFCPVAGLHWVGGRLVCEGWT